MIYVEVLMGKQGGHSPTVRRVSSAVPLEWLRFQVQVTPARRPQQVLMRDAEASMSLQGIHSPTVRGVSCAVPLEWLRFQVQETPVKSKRESNAQYLEDG